MEFLHTEIGSAKDNAKSPIHNWYKFTAGFSYKFVDEIMQLERLALNKKARVFDPFAGCGTTLVSAQKASISAVGNEAQDFMYEIILAKLNWKVDVAKVEDHLIQIRRYITNNSLNFKLAEKAHPLLISLYKTKTLKTLYLIKNYLTKVRSKKYRLFLKLALSQTLHKTSIHPIAVPYISRNRQLAPSLLSAWKIYLGIVTKMLDDCKALKNKKQKSKIYKQDSRIKNIAIKTSSCSTCITSPPYLNNLDYGEVSKVHTHFFGITENWNDITNRVRKNLVTGSTTHYIGSQFSLSNFKRSSFYKRNLKVAISLIRRYYLLKKTSAGRLGKKSFHILMMHYFTDMYRVIREIRRVLPNGAKAYLILGDSAPYGVMIPTTKILGQIALNTGFDNYKIIKIRVRGSKWKDLKYRHNEKLSENVLVLG